MEGAAGRRFRSDRPDLFVRCKFLLLAITTAASPGMPFPGARFPSPDPSSPYAPFPGLSWMYPYRYFIISMVAAHSLSRLMPVMVIQWSVNVTDPEHSKSRPATSSRLTPGQGLIAALFAFLPFFFLPWQFLLIVPAVLYVTYRLTGYFKKWIGGYTGDCLGAIQQASGDRHLSRIHNNLEIIYRRSLTFHHGYFIMDIYLIRHTTPPSRAVSGAVTGSGYHRQPL